MRIAVFHHLPSGGALKVLMQQVQWLAARGHELQLFSFTSAEQAFAPWPLEVAPVILPLELHGAGRFRHYLRASAELARRIAAWSPDVVWVAKCRLYGHPPLLEMLSIPTVLETHEPTRFRHIEALAPTSPDAPLHQARRDRSAGAALGRLLRLPGHLRIVRGDRRAMAAAQRVVTSSAFTAEWLRRAYGRRAEVLAPGIDTGVFAPSPTVARERRVVSVGRLAPAKGHDFALRVLAALPPAERPAWDLACDDATADERRRLEGAAVEAGVALTVHHRVNETALVQLYQRARAVLCAAHREPFGLVPPEAMACGTPVLAVREGGFAETVDHGVTGFLLPRQEAEWLPPLRRLLDDDALVARLGAAGVERIRAHWSAAGWVRRAALATALPL